MKILLLSLLNSFSNSNKTLIILVYADKKVKAENLYQSIPIWKLIDWATLKLTWSEKNSNLEIQYIRHFFSNFKKQKQKALKVLKKLRIACKNILVLVWNDNHPLRVVKFKVKQSKMLR